MTAFKQWQKIVTDEVSTNLTYVGRALRGTSTSSPAWLIERITVYWAITKVETPNGNEDYTQVWDDRASLSYS